METKLTVMEMSELINVIKDRGVDPDGAAVDIQKDIVTIHYQKDGKIVLFSIERDELHRTKIKRETLKKYRGLFDCILEEIATYFERAPEEDGHCLGPTAIKKDIDDVLKDVTTQQMDMHYRAHHSI